jgi:hypothetical protein
MTASDMFSVTFVSAATHGAAVSMAGSFGAASLPAFATLLGSHSLHA